MFYNHLYIIVKQFLFTVTEHQVKSTLTKRNRKRQLENETPIAFLATLTDHAEHLGVNQNIKFDNLITNIGDTYNSHGGVFIAPISGIYVFSTSIMSMGGTNSYFALLRNGSIITNMFYRGDALTAVDTTSVTVVLELSKGDDISVINKSSDITVHGHHYSIFTGFLLQEIYDESPVIGK